MQIWEKSCTLLSLHLLQLQPAPFTAHTVYHRPLSCLALHLLFHGPQRNSVSDQREAEGCAHMLLGNDSFSVPTQPADRQQDTIAALRATVRPHIQSLHCLAQQLRPWHACEELDKRSCQRAKVSVKLDNWQYLFTRCIYQANMISVHTQWQTLVYFIFRMFSRGLLADVMSPVKGLIHSDSHLLSGDYWTTDCFWTVFPPQHLQVWRAQRLSLRALQCGRLPDLFLHRDAL